MSSEIESCPTCGVLVEVVSAAGTRFYVPLRGESGAYEGGEVEAEAVRRLLEDLRVERVRYEGDAAADDFCAGYANGLRAASDRARARLL